jgi:hypothetical protein
MSTYEGNHYPEDEMLLDSGSVLKVLGIKKRRRVYETNNINKKKEINA